MLIQKHTLNIPTINILHAEGNDKDLSSYSNYGELWEFNDKENKFYKNVFCQNEWNFGKLNSNNKVIESINLRDHLLKISIDNPISKRNDNNKLEFTHCITLIQNDNKKSRSYYHSNEDMIKSWYQTMRRYCLLTNFKNHYEIIKTIAQGISSSVFLVREKNQKKSKFYTAKVIDIKKRILGEIMGEIKANQILKHKFIPEYHGAFFEKNKAILIFEYINGSTLLDYINTNGKLSEKQAALMLENLLQVLDYIHGCGFIHKDIKTSNILITEDGPNLNVKLIDYGLTKKPKDIDLSNCCGTPGFIAPEVINRKPHNYKVDVFGLGITLFTMLTGNLPFNSFDPNELLSQNEKYKEMVKHPFWKKISPNARDLIQKMTNFHPELRYSVAECLLSNWITISNNSQLSSTESISHDLFEKSNPKLLVSILEKSSFASGFEESTMTDSDINEGKSNLRIMHDYQNFQEKIFSTCWMNQINSCNSNTSSNILLNKLSSDFKLQHLLNETDIIDIDDNSDSIGSKLDFICAFLPKSKPNQY